ncbi:hypothetical protein ACF0H5_007470 [Mactra antiquata]
MRVSALLVIVLVASLMIASSNVAEGMAVGEKTKGKKGKVMGKGKNFPDNVVKQGINHGGWRVDKSSYP